MRQLERINAFLESGPHPIEPRFAHNLLTRFLAEMDAAQGGEDLVATLLKEKRHADRPTLIYQAEDGSFQTDEFSSINSRQGQIALLKLNGAMMQDDFLSTRGMRSFADDIRKADQNPNISGIVIEANTGGGELLAGQTLRNAIKDAKKPVLVYAHYLASAGVWGTLFAGHIMAAGEGSEVGSIGVYTGVNKAFLSVYKDRVLDIYSRKSPKKNAEFRALLDGDTKPLEDAVTEADEIFMADVRRNRPLSGDIEDTLSGGMFFADDAKARGLVDSIGTFQDAIGQIGRMIREQKSKAMNKVSFVALAKKFLGLDPATEEEAQTALEAAEAPAQDNKTTALEQAVNDLTATVTQLQADAADLRAKAEKLANDVQGLTELIPTGTATTEQVNADIQALKAELTGQINALKLQRSGGEVAGESAVTVPDGKKKEEGPAIDLLARARAAGKVKVIPGLQ